MSTFASLSVKDMPATLLSVCKLRWDVCKLLFLNMMVRLYDIEDYTYIALIVSPQEPLAQYPLTSRVLSGEPGQPLPNRSMLYEKLWKIMFRRPQAQWKHSPNNCQTAISCWIATTQSSHSRSLFLPYAAIVKRYSETDKYKCAILVSKECFNRKNAK